MSRKCLQKVIRCFCSVETISLFGTLTYITLRCGPDNFWTLPVTIFAGVLACYIMLATYEGPYTITNGSLYYNHKKWRSFCEDLTTFNVMLVSLNMLVLFIYPHILWYTSIGSIGISWMVVYLKLYSIYANNIKVFK